MFDQVQDASKIVLDKLTTWYEDAVSILPNFVIAILVIILFFGISKIITNILDRTLKRVVKNESVYQLIISLTSFLVILIGLFVALGVLNLDKTVTSLLAGIGVVGLALGFAFQHAAANLISGVIMAIKSPIFIGDVLEYDSHYGTVKNIGLRATTLIDPQGQDVIIPNRLIFENPYKHFTVRKERRIDLQVGISYGEDLQKVEDIVLEAIKAITYLRKDREVEFYYEEFGDSSINFVVRYWIDFRRPVDFFKARHDGIKRIKSAFNNNNITIPFPIRTLDFGIKGGEKLSAMFKEGEGKGGLKGAS
ncbi:MAG: mechanosensitive ion channel family protein [Candidatus Cyclobacteriaceae bacterium M2_1C_046]